MKYLFRYYTNILNYIFLIKFVSTFIFKIIKLSFDNIFREIITNNEQFVKFGKNRSPNTMQYPQCPRGSLLYVLLGGK